MDEERKLPLEPVPEPDHAKKHKQEEEYFLKEDEKKLGALRDKLRLEKQLQEQLAAGAEARQKSNRLKIGEAVLILIAALGLTRLTLLVKSGPIAHYADLVLAAIWLYLPAMMVWLRKESLKDFALAQLNLAKSLLWFLIAAAAIFPAFYAAGYLGALKIMRLQFQLTIPQNLAILSLGQLLLIALPEEWFFRGYLQGRFNQALGKKWKLFSAQVGPGLILTSALFALAHFTIAQSPDRLLVFFPALIFGWLREKTGSLLAPILFHFAANLTFIIFQMSLIK